MIGSKIQGILNKVDQLMTDGEQVKFFNEENKHYATLWFREYANYSVSGELEEFDGFSVKFYLPDGFSREDFEKHEYDDMIVAIYNALENSYEDLNSRMIEMAKKNGEQEALRLIPDDNSVVDIDEILKISYDHALKLWIFEYEDGKVRVEDEKHLAVQILNEFYDAESSKEQ